MNEENLYRRAIKLWGEEAQINMVADECAQLIKAIMKMKRTGDVKKQLHNFIEEVVDVEIMIEQMKILLEDSEIYFDTRERKIYGLKFKLDEGESVVNALYGNSER